MYTTSRYSSAETRKFARRLAEKNKERYTARGKKTVEQLVSFARKTGEEKITIVRERKKKPAVISVIEINERGGWRWAEESEINEG